MRIFFSVGEPSGDLHGSNLIRFLKQQSELSSESIDCVGFGGPKMADAGCELHHDLTQQAVMFFTQAIKNLPYFFKLIGEADRYFAENKVDAVVLIDYPGFNWWIASKAKKHGIPVFYYGVPQVWAWAQWRVKKIRRLVDHVLCKLPFEVDWFAERNCNATYVGHPYFDEIEHQILDDQYLERLNQDTNPLVSLLPGSRNQEVQSVLPILLASASKIQSQVPNSRFAIASFNEKQAEMAREQLRSFQQTANSKLKNIEIVVGKTPELMRAAKLCLACSGSVSMELMHYRTPTIIVFKINRMMMWLQSMVLKSKYITLVNLIEAKDIRKTTWSAFDPDAPGSEDPVMPEYLTTGDPSTQVANRAVRWLTDESERMGVVSRLDQLARLHAIPGATRRAGEYLLNQLGFEAASGPALPNQFSGPSARKTA